MTVHEPEWTDDDRALVLAWLEEQADICPSCGHPKSICRDKTTAGTWQVIEEICEPSRVAEALADNDSASGRKRRGVIRSTRRTPGIGG